MTTQPLSDALVESMAAFQGHDRMDWPMLDKVWRPQGAGYDLVANRTTVSRLIASIDALLINHAEQAAEIQRLREALGPFEREWEDMGIGASLADDMLMLDADPGGEILTVGHWRALMAALNGKDKS
jgi:hypothetical protein